MFRLKQLGEGCSLTFERQVAEARVRPPSSCNHPHAAIGSGLGKLPAAWAGERANNAEIPEAKHLLYKNLLIVHQRRCKPEPEIPSPS